MEAIRRYVEAEELMTILSLPEQYRNRKLEVIGQRYKIHCISIKL